MSFSDVEKTGETDFVEKPKSLYGTPFGKLAVPQKCPSSNPTHFGRYGHILFQVGRVRVLLLVRRGFIGHN